jgi:uncharacterized membrane protein
MPASAGFCPGCGQPTKPIASNERIAAAVSYSTIFPALVVLLVPALRASRFARFHAWQSFFLWLTFLIAAAIAITVSNFAAAAILLLLGIIAALGMFFLWVLLSLKAWLGERFELPLFGSLAGRLSP